MERRFLARAHPRPESVVRSGHALVFDTARQQVVLFGGSTNGAPRGDTWVYQSP